MNLRELRETVESTADAAFAIDPQGAIVAWNAAAEELFGVAAPNALGRFCDEVVRGSDETGPVCGAQCTIRQAIQQGRPLGNTDIEIAAGQGRAWCNVSILRLSMDGSEKPYSLHIVRAVDTCKRWELLLRDVVAKATGLSPERARRAIEGARSATAATNLSKREHEVLRLMAKGDGTSEIARKLSIEKTTASNHIQHVMRKLNVHTRLEAVRRAEMAGLV
jgi:PAS domain S-box-containing protein